MSNNIIQQINKLIIKNNLKEAIELLNKYSTLINKDVINYLNKKIQEKNKINSLSDDKLYVIQEYEKTGKELLNKKQYNAALTYFLKGLNETGCNIFNYYIGKTCFKMKSYNGAIPYLIKYNEEGIEKLFKSNIYLGVIANIKRESIDKYLDILHFISNIENLNFKTEMLDKNAYLTNEITKQFECGNQFDIQKLNEIKQLYLEGNIKKANHYLDIMISKKDKTKQEKKQIEELIKCKKLYIKKHKYSLN
ncbi:MAG: hypothetical protein PHN42_05895 [Bacilli bacterium]|nr:hypothetical protein [Bacilli bacterium]